MKWPLGNVGIVAPLQSPMWHSRKLLVCRYYMYCTTKSHTVVPFYPLMELISKEYESQNLPVMSYYCIVEYIILPKSVGKNYCLQLYKIWLSPTFGSSVNLSRKLKFGETQVGPLCRTLQPTWGTKLTCWTRSWWSSIRKQRSDIHTHIWVTKFWSTQTQYTLQAKLWQT